MSQGKLCCLIGPRSVLSSLVGGGQRRELIIIWKGKVSSQFRAGRLQVQDPGAFPPPPHRRRGQGGKQALREADAEFQSSEARLACQCPGKVPSPERKGVMGAKSPADISVSCSPANVSEALALLWPGPTSGLRTGLSPWGPAKLWPRGPAALVTLLERPHGVQQALAVPCPYPSAVVILVPPNHCGSRALATCHLPPSKGFLWLVSEAG